MPDCEDCSLKDLGCTQLFKETENFQKTHNEAIRAARVEFTDTLCFLTLTGIPSNPVDLIAVVLTIGYYMGNRDGAEKERKSWEIIESLRRDGWKRTSA